MGMPQHISGKEKKQQHVLLLSSYFPDRANSNIIITYFSQRLREELDCRISLEYLDSESATDFDKWKDWMVQSFGAYPIPPDVVVIIGSEGWNAYKAACPEAWKDIPVILGYMKNRVIDYIHVLPQDIKAVSELPFTQETFGDFRVTGYYVNDYFEENMRLIKMLQPEVRHLSYVYDNRYGFKFIDVYLEQIARKVGFESLRTLYGNELTTMQLADSLMAQDSSYATISSGWYTDVLNYSHAYSMLHNKLSSFTSKYFYLIMDQGMVDRSYLGGYYVSAHDIGDDLAGLTYDVLTKGFENSPKFQLTPSGPHYYINYKALGYSGIDESRLPTDVILCNKEASFWETYFWQSIIVSLVFISIIIMLVIWIHYYRRIARVKARMLEEQKVLRIKADESNRLKSAFLANMSHEIRTPLNAIVGFSAQLACTEDKEEVKAYVEIIETNNELLLQLINDILDMSKIEAGQLEFHYSDTDVVEVCQHLRQVYLSRIKEGVELICDVPDESLIVYTERNRITQVISNLLSNAVKFTEKGHIRFGYEHVGKELRFFAEDTGKGIAPENLPRVFGRFEKFDTFVRGNGLGMSICKSIIETMYGQIGVDSELGRGTTFWFTIPLGK